MRGVRFGPRIAEVPATSITRLSKVKAVNDAHDGASDEHSSGNETGADCVSSPQLHSCEFVTCRNSRIDKTPGRSGAGCDAQHW
jgi:hypothetical protein